MQLNVLIVHLDLSLFVIKSVHVSCKLQIPVKRKEKKW